LEHALTPRQDTPKSADWITGNLVSLGSVAVLAVYSAGYARTAEAARRFENEDRQRRETVRVPIAEPVAASPGVAAEASKMVQPSATKDTTSKKPAEKREKPAVVAKTDTAATPAAPVRSDTVPTPAPVAVAAAPTPAPAPPATQQDTTPVKGWKDGSYTGWGGSRHGDIQATVEIKDGKISAAWISICATQYSCSWIDALPGQVIARQSPEVDFVSGATQSTNAFYYAVVQALRKAK
jgi:uncharacterized protein with FMN-binding domain